MLPILYRMADYLCGSVFALLPRFHGYLSGVHSVLPGTYRPLISTLSPLLLLPPMGPPINCRVYDSDISSEVVRYRSSCAVDLLVARILCRLPMSREFCLARFGRIAIGRACYVSCNESNASGSKSFIVVRCRVVRYCVGNSKHRRYPVFRRFVLCTARTSCSCFYPIARVARATSGAGRSQATSVLAPHPHIGVVFA